MTTKFRYLVFTYKQSLQFYIKLSRQKVLFANLRDSYSKMLLLFFALVFNCLCGSVYAEDKRVIMNSLNSTGVDLRFRQMDQTIQSLKIQVSTYDNVVLTMQSKLSQ